jgi:hypothetical protein
MLNQSKFMCHTNHIEVKKFYGNTGVNCINGIILDITFKFNIEINI